MSILFIDESKAKGYTMVAVHVGSNNVASSRQSIRSLVLPRQRRIHFTKERPDRKHLIISKLKSIGVSAEVFHSPTKDQVLGRVACLNGIVTFAAEHSHTKLVIERDESIEKSDRRLLFQEVQQLGLSDTLSYSHEAPHQEPLLWAADAIAWSYNKGGEWRRRVIPLITNIHKLEE